MADALRTRKDFVPSGKSATTFACKSTPTISGNPDDLPEPVLQPELKRMTKQHHVFKYWMLEMLSVILAIGLIAAIISILMHFDGQILPDWPLGINLNTLIALLATLARALILLIVAEIISQTKWSWFSRQPRPINALERFDSGGRGVLGAMSLLITAPANIFSLAGSLVVIVSLAMGPFVQQAIKSAECVQYVSNANASVPIAHHAVPSSQIYRTATFTWRPYIDMAGAIVSSLVNPGGDTLSMTAACQTGNCTFHPDSTNVSYSSIGLCSLSINTTSLVSRVNVQWTTGVTLVNHTLPNGLSVFEADWTMDVGQDYDLTWATPAFTEEFSNLASLSLWNITVLQLTKASCNNSVDCAHFVPQHYDRSWNYVSATSIGYPCMKNYHAKVEKGTFRETIVSTVPASMQDTLRDGYFVPLNYTALKTPCLINETEYSVQNNFSDVPRSPGRIFTTIRLDDVYQNAPEECLYKMDRLYWMALRRFFQDNFSGSCRWYNEEGALFCEQRSWWIEAFYNRGNATFDTVSAAIENVATGATNRLRVIGTSNYDSGRHEVALGTVSQTTVCTVFDWQWLLLPIILVVTTALLLVLMLIQNSREPEQPVWKSSMLPFIFYGIRRGSPSEDEARPALNLTELDRQAGKVVARWYSGEDSGFVTSNSPLKKYPDQDIDMDSLLDSS